MGTIDIDRATRPTRTRSGGGDAGRATRFRDRSPPAAKALTKRRDGTALLALIEERQAMHDETFAD